MKKIITHFDLLISSGKLPDRLLFGNSNLITALLLLHETPYQLHSLSKSNQFFFHSNCYLSFHYITSKEHAAVISLYFSLSILEKPQINKRHREILQSVRNKYLHNLPFISLGRGSVNLLP